MKKFGDFFKFHKNFKIFEDRHFSRLLLKLKLFVNAVWKV
jgi:hypothetical protein